MSKARRIVVVAAIIALVAVSLGAVLAYGGLSQPPSQVQNVTIVASISGFNGSAFSPYSVNGVQVEPWPIIHVNRGTVINITVVNEDHQAHGFQIAHYLNNTINTIAPGQRVSFLITANESGTFRIFCSIFCTIHLEMRDGELVVS